MQVDYNRQALCHHCDLVVELPYLNDGEKANCPRCGVKLYQYAEKDNHYTIAYAVTALILLVIACSYFFVRIDVGSFFSSFTLPSLSYILFSHKNYLLLMFFVLFTLAVPIYCLVSSILLCMDVPLPYTVKIHLLRWLKRLRAWSMAEIFIVGILVSFVKITSYGSVSIGVSFIAYCLFSILLLKSFISIDPNRLWRHLTVPPKLERHLVNGKTGIEQGVKLCHDCRAILDKDEARCPRCGARNNQRTVWSMQSTMALLITAFLLYFPANYFPVMTTVFLGATDTSTILEGASYMWATGAYFVGAIIFIASVMIPSLKIIALSWLCWFSNKKTGIDETECKKMGTVYRMVEYIGRWSMIDVFVVITTAGIIRVSSIMSVYPNIGVIYFALVVIITIFAANAFDPRLIWDRLLIKEQEA